MTKLPTCCTDFEITWEHLLFPDRLPPEGRQFYMYHQVGDLSLTELQSRLIDLGNGLVRVYHRCKQLNSDGCCDIYETRPQICRDFDCTTRVDCACKGTGRLCNSA